MVESCDQNSPAGFPRRVFAFRGGGVMRIGRFHIGLLPRSERLPIEVDRLSLLEIKPGDVLVVGIDGRIPMTIADRLRATLAVRFQKFGVADILVVDGGARLQVVRPSQSPHEGSGGQRPSAA
jgi:hypothetical protein